MWNRMLPSKSKARTAYTGSREPIYSFCNFDDPVSRKSQRRREPALNPFSDPISVSGVSFLAQTSSSCLSLRTPPSQNAICASLICFGEIVSSSTCRLLRRKNSKNLPPLLLCLSSERKSPQVSLSLSLNPHYFKKLHMYDCQATGTERAESAVILTVRQKRTFPLYLVILYVTTFRHATDSYMYAC